MADEEKLTNNSDAPRRVRRPDQAALPEVSAEDVPQAEQEAEGNGEPKEAVEAAADGTETELKSEEPQDEVNAAPQSEPAGELPRITGPYRRNGLAVVDAEGTILLVAGAAHHSTAQRIGLADLAVEALNSHDFVMGKQAA
jgi:hypothetical protein